MKPPQPPKTILNQFKALGTYWNISIWDNLESVDIEIQKYIKDLIQTFDKNYSRFQSKSYISRLNRSHTLENPPAELVNLLSQALTHFKNTNGIFNIGVGGVLEFYGYGTTQQNTNKPIYQSLEEYINITKSKITTHNCTFIDLGGFGKGYLIDKIGEVLKNKYKIENFIINGGGDILASSSPNTKQTIYLQDPFNSKKLKAKLTIQNSAICSSSTQKRRWLQNNTSKTHIIDPNRMSSTLKEKYTFVSAKSCQIADMLATTLCIKKSETYVKELQKVYNFSVLPI